MWILPYKDVGQRGEAMPKKRSGVHGSQSWAVALLVPAFTIFALFEFYPLARTLFMSTQGTDLFGQPSGFVGAENYLRMFASGDFLRTLVTTLIFTVGTVAGKIVAGLAIAIPLSARLRGTLWLRSIVLVPMAMSVAATAVTFKAMLQPDSGPIDRLLIAFGITPPLWLTDPFWALFTVTVVDVWFSIGLAVLLFMAALDSMPEEVLEAAKVDGASSWNMTKFIRIPLVTPTIFFLTVTQSVHALRQFAIIQVMTGGGPNGATKTLTVDIYDAAFGAGTADYGSAAARGVVLMLIVMSISAFQFLVLERRVHYR